MKRIFFITILIGLCYSCGRNQPNNQNSKMFVTESGGVHLRKDSVKQLKKVFRLNGYWSCKGDGGKTIIHSKDSIEVEISSNQIWILSYLKQKNDSIYEMFLTRPSDLGQGGMNLDWGNFSHNTPIAELTLLNDSVLVKKWLGFYNVKKQKYEDQWALDWDACDTILKSTE